MGFGSFIRRSTRGVRSFARGVSHLDVNDVRSVVRHVNTREISHLMEKLPFIPHQQRLKPRPVNVKPVLPNTTQQRSHIKPFFHHDAMLNQGHIKPNFSFTNKLAPVKTTTAGVIHAKTEKRKNGDDKTIGDTLENLHIHLGKTAVSVAIDRFGFGDAITVEHTAKTLATIAITEYATPKIKSRVEFLQGQDYKMVKDLSIALAIGSAINMRMPNVQDVVRSVLTSYESDNQFM